MGFVPGSLFSAPSQSHHQQLPSIAMAAAVSSSTTPLLLLLLLLLALLSLLHTSLGFTPPISSHSPARRHMITATATTTTASTTTSVKATVIIDPRTLSTPVLKQKIMQLAAMMDRGKLQDPLIMEQEGGLYQAEKTLMVSMLEALVAQGGKMRPELLEGEWELVYSTRQLFRSSPFFQAIARAFNNPEKSELFFKLHELQTCSWGASQIGRVAQRIDLQNKQELVSEFDTILFGLTVIPIVGWFKLLPTFGGRVVSIADRLKVTEEEGGRALRLEYELAKTSLKKVQGLGMMPLVGEWLENKLFPTKEVWKLLPWNWGGQPNASVKIVYLDDDFRVVKGDGEEGGYFVYARPLL